MHVELREGDRDVGLLQGVPDAAVQVGQEYREAPGVVDPVAVEHVSTRIRPTLPAPPVAVRQELPKFPGRVPVDGVVGALEVVINQDGGVESAQMRKPVFSQYDQMVVSAAQDWRYQPARLNGVPVKFRHSEAQLAHYGVEMEFNDAIIRQWQLTLAAGVLLIVGARFMLERNRRGAGSGRHPNGTIDSKSEG